MRFSTARWMRASKAALEGMGVCAVGLGGYVVVVVGFCASVEGWVRSLVSRGAVVVVVVLRGVCRRGGVDAWVVAAAIGIWAGRVWGEVVVMRGRTGRCIGVMGGSVGVCCVECEGCVSSSGVIGVRRTAMGPGCMDATGENPSQRSKIKRCAAAAHSSQNARFVSIRPLPPTISIAPAPAPDPARRTPVLRPGGCAA